MIKISDLLTLLKTSFKHKNKIISRNDQMIYVLYKNLVFNKNHTGHIFWKHYYSNEKNHSITTTRSFCD